jgi:hypothetical protein
MCLHGIFHSRKHLVPTRATERHVGKRLDDDKYDTKKSLTLEVNPDGRFHSYRLDLASSPEYRGLMIGLAMEPVAQPRPGEEMAIKSIVLSAGQN